MASGQLEITRMVSGVAFSNGIATSHDGRYAAVASSTGQVVHVFDIDIGGKKFNPRSVVSVPFLPDNVEFESDGSITVAGHPHFPSLARVAAKKQNTAPSWVVSVRPRMYGINGTDGSAPLPVSARVQARLASTNVSYDVSTLYQSDGSHFSSSTTGLKVNSGKGLVVAGLYEQGLLHCEHIGFLIISDSCLCNAVIC